MVEESIPQEAGYTKDYREGAIWIDQAGHIVVEKSIQDDPSDYYPYNWLKPARLDDQYTPLEAKFTVELSSVTE